MGGKKPAAVPVGAVLARRLREARNARGWTQSELSARLGDLNMDRTTLAKIEKGQRQVRIEELVAFAVALDVSPLYLITPLDAGESIALTPKVTVDAERAWAWAEGEGPLEPENARTYRTQAPANRSSIEKLARYANQEGLNVIFSPSRTSDAANG